LSDLNKRIDRLHLIHQMIGAGGWTQEAIAVTLQVTVRTVRSDFKRLRERGAPLVNGGRNGWSYSEEWELKL
jgi:predicted DNA-binding transcriptional regulator YafY